MGHVCFEPWATVIHYTPSLYKPASIILPLKWFKIFISFPLFKFCSSQKLMGHL